MLAIILLAAITVRAVFSWSSISHMQKGASHITSEVIGQVEASHDFALYMSRVNGEIQAYALGGGDADLDQARQDLRIATKQIAIIQGLTGHEDEHSAAMAESYRALLVKRQELVDRMQAAINVVAPQADNGGTINVAARQASRDVRVSELKDELEAIERDIQTVDTLSSDLLRSEIDDTTGQLSSDISRLQFSTFSMSGFAAGAIIIGLLLLQAMIIRPVTRLSAAAGAVVAGDHRVQVAVTSKDEIGSLQQAFNTMITTLDRQQSDLREQVVSANEARSAAEHASATIAEQLDTILRQRELIREMDIPIIPVSDKTLVIPLVGTLDSDRIDNLAQRALRAVEQQRVRLVALDVTGTVMIDEVVARGLIHVLQSVRLIGAEVILVGVRPEVAQTIVQLGIDLRGMRSFSTLQSALKSAQLDLLPARVG